MQRLFKKNNSNENLEQHDHKFYEFKIEPDYILDRNTKYKGIFNNEYDIVVIYLFSSVGLGNVMRFPRLVYMHGGLAFVVLYIFMSFGFGIPVFIIESGLAQFYSVCESNLFKVVPYAQGLGWSIHFFNLVSFIPYSIVIEWYLHYLIYTLLPGKLPWSQCPDMPGIICTNSIRATQQNSSNIVLRSTVIFFEVDVKGIRQLSDGTFYQFGHALTGVRQLQFVLIIVVWVFVWINTWSMVRLCGKINYCIMLMTLLIMLILVIKSIFLSGAFSGIVKCLEPDLSKLITFDTIRECATQVMFSLCITKSTTSFASLSSFKFNFIKASILIVIGDILFSLLSGIYIFSTVGFLSKKLDKSFDEVFKSDLTFVGISEISIINSEKSIWIFLFMFMMCIIGITTMSAICGAFSISFTDFFPNLMNLSECRKTLVTVFICGTLCLFSIFYSLDGSVLYLDVFTHNIDKISGPMTMLSEVLLIQFVYGAKRLRMEIKMMIGYTYNIIWAFLSVTMVPTFILYILIYAIYSDYNIDAPMWALIISNIVTFIPLYPLISSFLSQMYSNFKSESGLNIIKVGFRTPNFHGPYYKMNWLLSKYYQRKLVIVRKDPEFLKTIRETEDLDKVLECLRRIYVKQKSVVDTL